VWVWIRLVWNVFATNEHRSDATDSVFTFHDNFLTISLFIPNCTSLLSGIILLLMKPLLGYLLVYEIRLLEFNIVSFQAFAGNHLPFIGFTFSKEAR